MKKKTLTTIFTIILIFSLISSSYALSQRDGKRKFKRYCHKECHDGDKKGIPVITPSTYTIEQWKYFFQDNMKRLRSFHKNGELDNLKLKEKHWKNMEAFLTNHGLGSFEPESCTN
ncbi:hypothetical protein OWM07_06190 [Deferribacter thermophilus]|uniref:hypothetical protein n=1 Tax=Deferribacter thermophilus TaxID=53573 RepID=UPI003C170707